MDKITKGKLGYNLLEKELLKRNFEIYTPVTENTKIDCIAIKDNKISRIQIKTIQIENGRKILPLRKINHNHNEYKVYLYTKKDIDIFVGVDLETEEIFICPVDFIENYSRSIGVSKLQEFKNNFNSMEPDTGNSISGADDIGESLTGNTEGME